MNISKITKTVTATSAIVGLAWVMGVASTGSANAGNFGIDLYLGHGPAVHYKGRHNRHNNYNRHRPNFHENRPRHRRGYKQRSHRNICGPRRAVKRAYRLGLYDPQIRRIKENRIVVSGYQYGYRTKMVFSRYSNCNLIKTVNFGR